MAKKKEKNSLYKVGCIPNAISLLLGIFMLTIKYMDFEGYALTVLLLVPPITFIFVLINKKIDDKKRRKISTIIIVIEMIVISLWFVWLLWPNIATPNNCGGQWDVQEGRPCRN